MIPPAHTRPLKYLAPRRHFHLHSEALELRDNGAKGAASFPTRAEVGHHASDPLHDAMPPQRQLNDPCNMASILSLPDEVLEIIGKKTEQHLGIKAWCRLTSTCRHLWMLQLPHSCRGYVLSSDSLSEISIEGKLPNLKLTHAAAHNRHLE